MSGVEAAGIALAVFPLLISALEHYRESAEVLGDWWKFKRKYTKCKRDIEYHQLTFTANLEELLLPLVADDEDMEVLISDPGGSRWGDPELEVRLRARLPNSYEAYLDSVNEIKEIMTGLKKELGLEKAHIQSRVNSNDDPKTLKGRVSKESLGYQGQRIKFALGATTREKLLDEFAKYNGRLRDLLRTGEKITAIKQSQKPKMGSVLTTFWRHAKALYNLLFESWGCACREDHHANLLLCHRTSSASLDFQLLFLFARDIIKSQSLHWSWHEALVKVADKPRSNQTKSHPQPLSNISNAKSATFTRQSILSRSRVSSMASSTSSMTYSAGRRSTGTMVGVSWTDSQTTLVSSTEDDDPNKQRGKLQENSHIPITNLCGDLCKGPIANGCLEDEETETLYIMRTNDECDKGDIVPLDRLLSRDPSISFSRRKRYHLALILASSQVQLHSTKWLKNGWNKSDIVFTKEKNGATSADKPHISCDFSSHDNIETDDHSVATLGMLLLELCFGIQLSDHPIRQRLPKLDGPQNFYLDLAAALEWSGQVSEEAGPAYSNAVNWCLSQHAAPNKDEKWRGELYANVVKPLQDCFEHLG